MEDYDFDCEVGSLRAYIYNREILRIELNKQVVIPLSLNSQKIDFIKNVDDVISIITNGGKIHIRYPEETLEAHVARDYICLIYLAMYQKVHSYFCILKRQSLLDVLEKLKQRSGLGN